MNIIIDNAEILNRMHNRIAQLKTYDYSVDSNILDLYESIDHLKDDDYITLINFCLDTNTNYRHLILGETPICDTEGRNKLYKRLIDKKDFTL